ncbi:hypothetical protein C8R47DRAFT_1200007 [Mycena vitilis]|nr:hypothetical protein C8R47DRAFT_1200007 [Mycena vitilis]
MPPRPAKKGKATAAKPKRIPKKTPAGSDYEEGTVPAKRKVVVIPPRDPLPMRSKRKSQPGAPDMPMKKRTSEQVAEVDIRKKENSARLEALEIEKIALLASIEREQDIQAAQEADSVMRDIDDLGNTISDESAPNSPRLPGEFADRRAASDDDEGVAYLDTFLAHYKMSPEGQPVEWALTEGSSKAVAVSPPLNPRKKKGKEKLRDAVAEQVGKMKATMPAMGNSKKLQALFPTGLRDDWKRKPGLSAGAVAASSSKPAGRGAKAGSKKREAETEVLGGFTDTDSLAIGPSKSKHEKALARYGFEQYKGVRDMSRTNDAVQVIDDSDDDEDVVVVAPRLPKPRKIIAPMALVKTEPLAKTVGSQKEYGLMYGAVGLTAAALERVFTMFLSGTFVRDEDAFSRDVVGDMVDDYIANALEFPVHRWEQTMERCGAAKKAAPTTSALSVGNRRRSLYVASSP